MTKPTPLPIIALLLSSAFVACGLFQAPPQTSAQDISFPPTISSGQVQSVNPSAGSLAVAPNAGVSVTFSAPPDQASTQANFVLLPGLYTTNIGTQKLTLTAMCNGRWRVRNPAASTVVFTWDVYNTTEKGSGIVPGSSDAFFTTTPGQKTVRVFVAGGLHNTKAANTTACTGSAPAVPGRIEGGYAWNGNTLSFAPNQSLQSKTAYTVFVGLAQPYAGAFETGGGLRIDSAAPTSLSNDRDTTVTVNGLGFNSNTSFFIQSNRLELLNATNTTASLRVPAGFLPSVYGLMAANADGTRATLYPALTITQGAAARAIDPQRNARAFVEGYVTDYATGAALGGAKVSLNSLTGSLETLTDASGYYLVRGVPSGKQSFRIEKAGYEPVYRIANLSAAAESYPMKLAALEPKSDRVTNIGPAGGTHYATDAGAAGPFLQIPAGALDSTVPIQFTQLRDASTLPELPQDGSFLAFAHLGPTGLTFKKPATLFLPLQAGISIPVGTKINIFYFDAKRAEWVDDITSGKISNVSGKLFLEYEINHFTWIGGSWFPDPVRGCTKYPNGTPATRIATNYGISDGAGNVIGSTTRSDIGRVLTLSAYGHPGSTTSSAPYTDGSPVNFSCITIPAPEPVDFSPVPVNAGSCGNGPGVIAPFSTRALEAMRSPVSRQDTTPTRQLVLAQDTFGFTVEIPRWRYSGINSSSLKLELGGVDYTSKADFVYPSPNDPDGLQVKLTLSEPLKAQVGLEARASGVTSSGLVVSRSTLLDIAAKLNIADTEIVFLPDEVIPQTQQTPDFSQSLFSNSYILRQGQTISSVKVSIRAVDENDDILNLNTNSYFRLDSTTWINAQSTELAAFINGIAQIPVRFSFPISSNVSVNEVLNKFTLINDQNGNSIQRNGTLPSRVFCAPVEQSNPIKVCKKAIVQIDSKLDSLILVKIPASFRDKLLGIRAALRKMPACQQSGALSNLVFMIAFYDAQPSITLGQIYSLSNAAEKGDLVWMDYLLSKYASSLYATIYPSFTYETIIATDLFIGLAPEAAQAIFRRFPGLEKFLNQRITSTGLRAAPALSEISLARQTIGLTQSDHPWVFGRYSRATGAPPTQAEALAIRIDAEIVGTNPRYIQRQAQLVASGMGETDAWIATSIEALDDLAANRTPIVFELSNVPNLQSIFSGRFTTRMWGGSVSEFELQHIIQNQSKFGSIVRYTCKGQLVTFYPPICI